MFCSSSLSVNVKIFNRILNKFAYFRLTRFEFSLIVISSPFSLQAPLSKGTPGRFVLLKRKAGDLNGVISYKLLPDGSNYYTHHGIYLLDLKMFLKILDLSGLCLIPSILCVCVFLF